MVLLIVYNNLLQWYICVYCNISLQWYICKQTIKCYHFIWYDHISNPGLSKRKSKWNSLNFYCWPRWNNRNWNNKNKPNIWNISQETEYQAVKLVNSEEQETNKVGPVIVTAAWSMSTLCNRSGQQRLRLADPLVENIENRYLETNAS